MGIIDIGEKLTTCRVLVVALEIDSQFISQLASMRSIADKFTLNYRGYTWNNEIDSFC